MQRFRIENSEGNLVYDVASSEDDCHHLKATVSGTKYSLLPSERLPPTLLTFEDKNYILPMSEDGIKISEISFPRLGATGLSLQYDEQGKVYRNSANKHEVVAYDQHLAMLPRLDHKLILIDEKTGNRKILIPGHRFETSSVSDSPFSVSGPFSRFPDEEQIPVYSYQKVGEHLIPENSEAAAYLAYTCLWQQQYEESARILDSMERLPLSQRALDILFLIEKGARHDNDPRSIAIRMKAHLALRRQNVFFNQEPTKKLQQDQIYMLDSVDIEQEYDSCKHLCGNIFLTVEESVLSGHALVRNTIDLQRKGGIIPSYTLDTKYKDYFIARLKSVGLTSAIKAPSPVNPHLDVSGFMSLGKIFQGGKPEDQWINVQQIFKQAFGVDLKACSVAEVERVKIILDIGARMPCSDQQTACAILLAVYLFPKKFDLAFFDTDDDVHWLFGLSRKADELFDLASKLLSPQHPNPIGTSVNSIPIPPAPMPNAMEEAQLPHTQYIDPGQKSIWAEVPEPWTCTPQGTSQLQAQGFIQEATALLQSDSSPISQKACEDTEKAVSECINQKQLDEAVEVNKPQLSEAIALMTQKGEETKKQTKEAKKEIKALLHKTGADEQVAALYGGIKGAEYVRRMEVRDAEMALLSPRLQGFMELNPTLTVEEAQQLRDATIRYLELKTYQQHLQSILSSAKKIQSRMEKKKESSPDEIQAIRQAFTTKREYDPLKFPHLLVFEKNFGHYLRKQQVKNLDLFLSGDKEASSKVLEMIMAGGKTSVLMPIVTKMIASRGKLSIAVLPQQLFPSMAPQIAQALQQDFGTQSFSWDLKTNERVSVDALRAIDQGLKIAAQEHHVVLVKPKDITGLFLQFLSEIEKLPDETAAQKIPLFQSIFGLFSEKGEMLFDEVDSIWDVLKEHLLATSDVQPLDATTRQVSVTLYELLLAEKKAVTKEEFIKDTAPVLCKNFLARLLTSEDNEVQRAAKEHEETIRTYLANEGPSSSLMGLPERLQDMLAVARTQIHDILPVTYTRVLDVDYGKDPEEQRVKLLCAIPFDKGEPVDARFGHDLEEVNYTIQMFLGLSEQDFTPYLLSSVRSFHDQFQRELEEDPESKLEETSAYSLLRSMTSPDVAREVLQCPAERGAKIIDEYLSKSPTKKVAFIDNLALSKLQRPQTYTRVSSEIYRLLTSVLRGFSGTLWNKDTYPVSSEPSPESVGRTLSIISDEEKEVRVFSSADVSKIYEKNAGIIDIGGALKDVSGKEVARQILANNTATSINGVIFYGEDKLPKVLDRKGRIEPYEKCSLKRKELIAYWGQPYTNGSDLRVATNSTCAVVIGKDTILRDVLQGVWRLRNLGKGQHVHFVVSDETQQIICTSLGLPAATKLASKHIIAYTLKKQTERQALDNFRAVQHKAEAAVQEGFVKFLLNSSSNLVEGFDACKELFLQQKPPRPFDRYGDPGQTTKTSDAVEKIITDTKGSKACQYLTKKGYVNKQKLEQQLEKLKEMEKVLPTEVSSMSSNAGTMVQIQTQTQTQTQTQVEQGIVELSLYERMNIEKCVKEIRTNPHASIFTTTHITTGGTGFFGLNELFREDPTTTIHQFSSLTLQVS